MRWREPERNWVVFKNGKEAALWLREILLSMSLEPIVKASGKTELHMFASRSRTGEMFMDCNMNVRGKTMNVAYSPRGVSGTPVSMPLKWEELASSHPLDFRITNAAKRLAQRQAIAGITR